MKKLGVLLLMIFVISSVSAATVVRELSKSEIRSGYEDYEPLKTVDVTLHVDVGADEPFYIIREHIPNSMIIKSTDLSIIDNTFMAGLVMPGTSDTFSYTLVDGGRIIRYVRFYGDFLLGSDYLNWYETTGDELLKIKTVWCETEADLNGDKKISHYEWWKYRGRWRRGEVSTSSYRLAKSFYKARTGC